MTHISIRGGGRFFSTLYSMCVMCVMCVMDWNMEATPSIPVFHASIRCAGALISTNQRARRPCFRTSARSRITAARVFRTPSRSRFLKKRVIRYFQVFLVGKPYRNVMQTGLNNRLTSAIKRPMIPPGECLAGFFVSDGFNWASPLDVGAADEHPDSAHGGCAFRRTCPSSPVYPCHFCTAAHVPAFYPTKSLHSSRLFL